MNPRKFFELTKRLSQLEKRSPRVIRINDTEYKDMQRDEAV